MIRIGHTPDADDAFMFYGINSHRVDLNGLEIVHELQPMQQLNRWSLQGELEMTAFSFATYARPVATIDRCAVVGVWDTARVLRSGAAGHFAGAPCARG